MSVDLCAGRTAEGHAVEWVTRTDPIRVRALQIMVAMESEDLGIRTIRAGDLGLSRTEAARLAGDREPLLFARTEG